MKCVLLTSLLLGVAACGTGPSYAFEAPRPGMLPTQLSDIGYIRVLEKGVFAPVRNNYLQYNVGDQLPLIQRNQRYYIALTSYESGYSEMCAFPRVNLEGEGTAWITEQQDLIFGIESESSFGRLYLRPSEVLPIASIQADHYVVKCERYNRVFSLLVPKTTIGIEFQQTLPDHVIQLVRQRDLLEKRLAQADLGSSGTAGDPAFPPQTSTISTEKIEAAIAAVSPFALEIHPALLEATFSSAAVSDSSAIALSSAREDPSSRITIRNQGSSGIAFPPSSDSGDAVDSTYETTEASLPSPGSEGTPTPIEEEVEEAAAMERFVSTRPQPEDPDPDAAPSLAETAPLEFTQADVEFASIDYGRETDVEVQPAIDMTVDSLPPPTVTVAILKLIGFLCGLAVAFILVVFALARIVSRKGASKRHAESTDVVPPPVPAETVSAAPPEAIPAARAEKPAATPPKPGPDQRSPSAFEQEKGGTFTGSLHGFDISELIQFLNASKETGTLSITENESPNQSKVMFNAGEIVNAVSAGKTGNEALAGILSLRDGFFVFKRQLQTTSERTITQGTMSLLMSLHQKHDEGAVSTGS